MPYYLRHAYAIRICADIDLRVQAFLGRPLDALRPVPDWVLLEAYRS